MRYIACSLVLVFLSGCSTARGRFLVGATTGAVVAGGSATAFSPNTESRGMNALIFGLAGALVGGTLGLLTYDDGKIPKAHSSLQEQSPATGGKLYSVPVTETLPEFVKKRFQAPVVEELIEPDTVSDDGSLHEPHKVYRIQRNAELYAQPPAQKQKEEK